MIRWQRPKTKDGEKTGVRTTPEMITTTERREEITITITIMIMMIVIITTVITMVMTTLTRPVTVAER